MWEYWNRTLGAVYVETPDPSINAGERLAASDSGMPAVGAQRYYQSGGAFRFRDQLQDSMALIHCEPALAREHLLRCASRQFQATSSIGGIRRPDACADSLVR